MEDNNHIQVTIIEGRDLRAGHWLDSLSDPYVNVRIKDHPETKKRTKVLTNTNHPVWNETFRLPFNSIKDELEIHCWNKAGLLMNPTLGKAAVPLTSFAENGDLWVKLDGVSKGELHIRVELPKSESVQWQELLERTTIESLLQAKSTLILIVCYSTERIGDFLELLTKHNLLSAPILDTKTRQFLGFLDVMDIAQCAHRTSLTYTNPELTQRHFLDQRLFTILPERPAIPQLKGSDTLLSAVRLFAGAKKRSTGDLHRLPIFNEQGQLVNVLSQTDVVKFAAEQATLIPHAKTPIEFLAYLNRIPISLPKSATLAIGIETLCRNRVRAVALLDETGRLWGQFSVSSLRGAGQDFFSRFSDSIEAYLNKTGAQKIAHVASDTTVCEVTKQMIQVKAHRMFVTNSLSQPTFVVTMSDLVRHLNPSEENTDVTPGE